MNTPGVINIWVGDWGQYIVPDEVLKGAKITKRHWYDRRYKKANDKLKAWVAEQERKARDGNHMSPSFEMLTTAPKRKPGRPRKHA